MPILSLVLTLNQMKEELAALRVDWVYHSKVNKPKLVALLHRLKKGEKCFDIEVVIGWIIVDFFKCCSKMTGSRAVRKKGNLTTGQNPGPCVSLSTVTFVHWLWPLSQWAPLPTQSTIAHSW